MASSSSSRTWRYDVFFSFHGPDARGRFLSHLRRQFGENGITMFYDEEIERGQIITPALEQAITESRIAILILSKKYASSSWCLDELLKIMECKETKEQIVMTIFYGVEPSDVRNQTGEFGIAFNETCSGKTEEQRTRWSQGLHDASNIAGYDFKNCDNEAETIKEIGKEVSDKLHATPCRDFDGMVGLEAHLRKMESLLHLSGNLDATPSMIVGICGPAGIGKSTIARALHSQHSKRFQLTCFMDNLGGSNHSGRDEYSLRLDLQKKLLSKIFNLKGITTRHLGVIEDRLQNQRVLIILDDVKNKTQLEALAYEPSWFGPGSRIVITTKNKELLQQHGINNTYHVGFPSYKQALEILCNYAFRQSYPCTGFQKLAERVTELCRNLPLDLRILGSSLCRKNEDEWKREIDRLESVFDQKHDCCNYGYVQEKEAQTSEVQEKQVQSTIVGQEIILDKAWKHLNKDGVGVMGMYGMGGVGKTTLLKQINNKFSEERCGFHFVIWVVVSKELHIENIQDEIALKVGLGGEEWKEKEKSRKIDAIFNFLRKKKFVLFLDDIWEKVDLDEIGIPFPTEQNGCKVVFTTRSQAVCTHMGVQDPMEVQCLGENEAFDLFQKKVGQITLGSDPEIPNLARTVAKKCRGLPLALNVIGETMSCKRTIQEWRHANEVLSSYTIDFSGMKDKILPLLKYSYDNLEEEHVKPCLLYCALFPEDDQIPKGKLIDYWICEGIIDGSRGIERAENKGYEIIGSLVRASLLMEKFDELGRSDSVCMHDVVREMALWIATDLGIEKEAFIVHTGVGLNEMPKVKNWNVVRRMSLIKNKIDHLAGKPECLELTTLLLQADTNLNLPDSNLANISSEFFKSMPKLVVLDLSGNQNLCVLPEEISELVSLQYLNLSDTGIRHLPMGLQKLKELIHLDLQFTTKLASIVGISSLHSLRVLKLTPCSFTWDHATMAELKTLEHLQVLTLGINPLFALEIFLSSHRLTSCTRILGICDINMESSGIVLPETMDKLCRLVIEGSTISEIKMVSPLHNMKNLSAMCIWNCKGLKELTLLMFAQNLKDLIVEIAEQLEDIINKEKACESEESKIVPFPKLICLELTGLPKLKNIYWSPLPFPCLKKISVTECPNLKKLPLDSQSGKHGENGLFIKYDKKEWIKGVEWEDEATKTCFLSLCKEYDF